MEASQRSDLREPESFADVDWQSLVAEREEQARDLIRAHPIAALVGAAAVGFVLARLLRDDG